MNNKVKYEYTKTPLEYQITEYDCGTTTLLNAFKYLFKRSEISPEIYKYVMQYTLDQSNELGEIGKGGTSTFALKFLIDWLSKNGKNKGMNIKGYCLENDEVSIYSKKVEDVINNGGVAILSMYQDCEHYCLLTKIDDEYAYLFDPYYLNINYYDKDEEVEIIKDKPFEYNRKVKKSRLEKDSKKDFSLVRGKNSQIVLIERHN